MITCEEFTDRITAYLEGSVPMGERMGLWMHALLCKHCRRYLRQFEAVIELVGELDRAQPAELDEATRQRLLELFRQQHAPSAG
jgi:anti-sigma factor ChrR (cupin superfamily)